MGKYYVILLKTVCWLVVICFAAATVETNRLFFTATRPGSIIWCGNSITDPIGAVLSIGSPLGFVAAISLGVLWRRAWATGWSFASATLITSIGTTSLLVCGIGFFREFLPGFQLSDIVWWLHPLGRFLGV